MNERQKLNKLIKEAESAPDLLNTIVKGSETWKYQDPDALTDSEYLKAWQENAQDFPLGPDRDA